MVLKCIMQFVDRFYVINLCNTEADSIHSFHGCLLSTYPVSGSVLNAKNKSEIASYSHEA